MCRDQTPEDVAIEWKQQHLSEGLERRSNNRLFVNTKEYKCEAGASTKTNGKFGDRASNFTILSRFTNFGRMEAWDPKVADPGFEVRWKRLSRG